MAHTRRRVAAAAPAEPPKAAQAWLLERARAVATRVADLKAALAEAQRISGEAQMREAVIRTELTMALHAALAGRAEAAARLRAQALAAFVARGGERPRRHNRVSKLIDKGLSRLGRPGQWVVARRCGPGGRLFDAGYYLARYPDVARAGVTPLVHYLTAGGREGRSPHPLIHGPSYAEANAAGLGATGLTALEHYVRIGGPQGRDPHPAFDTAHYLAQGAWPAAGETPLEHYLREGWRVGLSPHPLFDLAWYAEQAGPAEETGPPLLHYLTAGWREGRSPHPLFDPAWYRAAWFDEAAEEPLTHFLTIGAAGGCSPGPWFDLPHYVAQRGDALAEGVNPLVDYVRGGAWDVADARPGFPTAAYLAANPDLVRQGVTPLEHWARRSRR